MGIEKVPLIESLNNWVEELPPEHRSKAYGFAKSFFCVGAMHGIFEGAGVDSVDSATRISSSAISGPKDAPKNIPEKPSGNQQKEYMAYLSKKVEESKI